MQVDPGLIQTWQRVWSALCAIPPGETRSYAEIAWLCGTTAPIVAQACIKNPDPPRIPCHRVIHSDGRIGGYAFGGPARKAALLKAEGWLDGRRMASLF